MVMKQGKERAVCDEEDVESLMKRKRTEVTTRSGGNSTVVGVAWKISGA